MEPLNRFRGHFCIRQLSSVNVRVRSEGAQGALMHLDTLQAMGGFARPATGQQPRMELFDVAPPGFMPGDSLRSHPSLPLSEFPVADWYHLAGAVASARGAGSVACGQAHRLAGPPDDIWEWPPTMEWLMLKCLRPRSVSVIMDDALHRRRSRLHYLDWLMRLLWRLKPFHPPSIA